MATAVQYTEPYHAPPLYAVDRGVSAPTPTMSPAMMNAMPMAYPARSPYSTAPPPMHRMHTFTQGVPTPRRHRRGPSITSGFIQSPMDHHPIYNGPVFGGQAIAPHQQYPGGFIAVTPGVELNTYTLCVCTLKHKTD